MLLFLGRLNSHQVAAERLSQCTITATIPGTVVLLYHVPYQVQYQVHTIPLLPSPLPPPLSLGIGHDLIEDVQLKVCLNHNGHQSTLFQSLFTYTVDEKGYLAELLVQSVADSGIPIYCVFPPLPTVDALREFDQSLTEALKNATLPEGWSLVGTGAEPTKAVAG